ncbi:unnamed protein product [Heligmosomoides polygyrus]|uniref:Uncharacterized protein n=1 Tax=Heligmosomoides polygyrus TaxID=6339 RepID=A0A183GSE3_HELPZ|nr:unnamed protein product [Heligmosomoides polygyrus]
MGGWTNNSSIVVGETGADHNDTEFQPPVDVLLPSESLELMASCGSTLFCCGRRSTNIYAVDAFSLKVFNHFGIAACVRNELTDLDRHFGWPRHLHSGALREDATESSAFCARDGPFRSVPGAHSHKRGVESEGEANVAQRAITASIAALEDNLAFSSGRLDSDAEFGLPITKARTHALELYQSTSKLHNTIVADVPWNELRESECSKNLKYFYNRKSSKQILEKGAALH